jgi:hypothetical protein
MSQSSPGVISVTDLYLLLPAPRFLPQKMGKTLRRRRGRRTRPDCRSRDAGRYRLRSSLRNRRLGAGAAAAGLCGSAGSTATAAACPSRGRAAARRAG